MGKTSRQNAIDVTLIGLLLLLAACSSGGNGAPPVQPPAAAAPAAPSVSVDAGTKQLIFSWAEVAGATYYKLLGNPDGHSGFIQVGANIPAGTTSVSLPVAIHLHDFTNALYVVEACNAVGCNGSTQLNAMNGLLAAIGYFKPSEVYEFGEFGFAVALSANGDTLAVGEWNIRNVVSIFRFDSGQWALQSELSSDSGDFGYAIALSSDGNTLAVGDPSDSSGATGINGDRDNDLAPGSGAAYVFRFDGTIWQEQAYIKASNTGVLDGFAHSIALSADGNTMVAGAVGEDSNATGINGDQFNDLADHSGAAYIYRFDGTQWSQQAYVKASNTGADDDFGGYGAISLSADGDTLAVGAGGESSNATGINGDQNNDLAPASGAVYVYRFDGTKWSQQAYVKATNTESYDGFGWAVALSGNGDTLAVTAPGEDSNATGINGDQDDNSIIFGAGAVYVFQFDSIQWSQEAYVKASNTKTDYYGFSVAMSADGTTLAVGAIWENSSATGINGDQSDEFAADAGAVYVFEVDGGQWSQLAYVKASNTGGNDKFGFSVALSANGSTLAVGALTESSNATGINGDQNDDSMFESGAVYLY